MSRADVAKTSSSLKGFAVEVHSSPKGGGSKDITSRLKSASASIDLEDSLRSQGSAAIKPSASAPSPKAAKAKASGSSGSNLGSSKSLKDIAAEDDRAYGDDEFFDETFEEYDDLSPKRGKGRGKGRGGRGDRGPHGTPRGARGGRGGGSPMGHDADALDVIAKARERHGDRADELLYRRKKKNRRRRGSKGSKGSRSGKGGGGGGGGRRPSKELQMRAVNRLTGARKHSTSKKVSERSKDWELYDERGKKATFRFKMNKKSRELAGGNVATGDDDDEDGPKDTFTGSDTAFFARQDTKIAKLRKELERARGERAYNARVDKKVCPSCGASQTYVLTTPGRPVAANRHA